MTGRLSRAIGSLEASLWTLTTGIIEVIDETQSLRRRTRDALEAMWQPLSPEKRQPILGAIVEEVGVDLRGLILQSVDDVRVLVPLRAHTLLARTTVGVHGEVVATGIVATWFGHEWGRLALGLGVVPSGGDPGAALEDIYQRDLIPGGAIWLNYMHPPRTDLDLLTASSARRFERASEDIHRELAHDLVVLFNVMASRVVLLVSATHSALHLFAREVEAAWALAEVEARLRLYDEFRSELDRGIAVMLQAWLASRSGKLQGDTIFHSDVTVKPAKQEVGPGQTAYGGKVVVDGDPPSVEVGVGAIPSLPKTQAVLDHPAGEILNKDRVDGVGFWAKFNY